MANHNGYFASREMKLIIEEYGKVSFCTFFSHSHIAFPFLDTVIRMNKPFWAHFLEVFFWEGIKKVCRWEQDFLEWQLIWIFIPEKPMAIVPFFLINSQHYWIYIIQLWGWDRRWILYHLHFLYIFILILNKKDFAFECCLHEIRWKKGFYSISWMNRSRYSRIQQRTHEKHQTFVIFLFLFRKKKISSNFLLFSYFNVANKTCLFLGEDLEKDVTFTQHFVGSKSM